MEQKTGAGNRLVPALSSPRQPVGTRVPVPTSAKLHRLCHVLGVENCAAESRTWYYLCSGPSRRGSLSWPLRQRCSDGGSLCTAGDGYEGSLKVPIEESESKRRSDESQLTRNRNNSTVTKRPEILPETCPKSRFYFLERLVSTHPHVAHVACLRYQSPGLKPRSLALYQKSNSDPAPLAPSQRSG